MRGDQASAKVWATVEATKSTAVDTSGYCRRDDLLEIAPLVDLFLFDLKVIDDKLHTLYTGVSNQSILSNLRVLAEVHSNLWIRVPVIPGWNDDRENLVATAEIASALPAVRQIHLLPYHGTGIQKQERLGQNPSLRNVTPPEPAHLQELAGVFAEHGLKTHVGGSENDAENRQAPPSEP